MASITGNIVERPVLTNLSIDYRNDSESFIASKVCPRVKVKKAAGTFIAHDKSKFNRTTKGGRRAPGTRSERVSEGYTPITYSCAERSFEDFLDDEEKDNADDILQLETQKGFNVTDKALLEIEADVASQYFNATNFAGKTSALTHEWDDYVNSTPVQDVKFAREKVRLSSGIPGSELSLVINEEVFGSLIDHPDIVERFKYTGRPEEKIDKKILADIFQIKEVHVGRAIYNSAAEGATETLVDIWSNEYALICFIPPKPGVGVASVGYDFFTKELNITSYRDEPNHSDVIRSKEVDDAKFISNDFGYLYSNVTT